MNNAKDIAEIVINSLVPEAPTYILARAYLELEKELTFRKDAEIPVYKEEITKLEEENETLSKDLKMCREIGVEMQREVNRKLSVENEKLKKSREVLRKAVEYYGDFETWNRGWDGKSLPEDEAREAIKADDEIIGGVK
jgi:Skp family chaperone for outer membrane proteins